MCHEGHSPALADDRQKSKPNYRDSHLTSEDRLECLYFIMGRRLRCHQVDTFT
ncbi:hypothetical protein KFK09_009518 [Dendrobium nobile]|uniref:Uncharacterized protein n=1 Tax=Dendrobium nobile TaxID=94219 RepID=A0A8T3BHN8_DENNO|nr:hypothetical protein KFK09_009518 [Dendrobium nobile]